MLVYFEGQWSEGETTLIEDAAQTAEYNFPRPNPEGVETPWIAVSHEVGDESVYAASRYQQSGVLRAKTPESLAEKITSSGSGERKLLPGRTSYPRPPLVGPPALVGEHGRAGRSPPL
jgi:hypothetical protein